METWRHGATHRYDRLDSAFQHFGMGYAYYENGQRPAYYDASRRIRNSRGIRFTYTSQHQQMNGRRYRPAA